MNIKVIILTAFLLLWLGPVAFVAASVDFQPGACRIPFYGWLTIWPVFAVMPETWRDAFVVWTFSFCP